MDNTNEKGPKKISFSSRTIKNSIMIILAAALIVAMVFTSGIMGRRGGMGGQGGPGGQMPGGQPGQEMQQGESGTDNSGEASDNKQSNGTDATSGATEQYDGGDQGGQNGGGQPPQMPNGDFGGGGQGGGGQSDNSQNGGQPPEMPEGGFNGGQNGGGQPPQMPEGGFNGGQNGGGQNGVMPGGQAGSMPGRFGIIRIILFCLESLLFALIVVYLIMSGFNRKTVRETLSGRKRIAAFILASLIAGGAIGAAGTILPMKLMRGGQPGQMQGGPGEQMDSNVQATGANTVDGEKQELNGEYTSTEADQNAVLVTGEGSITSEGATINKKSGDGSNTENCDQYGINAALLVNDNSTATIKNAKIKSSATMSNAVFCTGEKSTVNISDSEITTTGQRSCRGLDATFGGTINADNVTITTNGGSCATLATDKGEGTVSVRNSTLTTKGTGSPVIYSTGNISITDTTGTSEASQCVVVEGKNSATVTNSKITASGTGNRGDVDVCGVMLYQSMSGDAGEGTASFTSEKSALSIDKDSAYYKTAPMFFITNTSAVINLTDTELNFGSGILLNAAGTSAWGNQGSNGGTVELNAYKQTLKGDVTADTISEITLNFADGTNYKGSINSDNQAGKLALTLSKDSKIILTGDSYVSSLEDGDSSYSNIDLNGHKLYVDGKELSK